MGNVFQQAKASKATKKARTPKQHEYASAAYGRVDGAARAGDPKGSYLTYHFEGEKSGKQLSKLVINVPNIAEIIKGEIWANNQELPRPSVVPFDAIPGFESRSTVRPFRDGTFVPYEPKTDSGNQFFAIFAQALQLVLADPVYGEACQSMVEQFEIDDSVLSFNAEIATAKA